MQTQNGGGGRLIRPYFIDGTDVNPDGKVEEFEASAQTGEGVFETLKALAKLVLADLKKGAK